MSKINTEFILETNGNCVVIYGFLHNQQLRLNGNKTVTENVTENQEI